MFSKGIGGRSGHAFKHGALIESGGRILCASTNSGDYTRRMALYYDYPFAHAETECCLSLHGKVGRSMSLYVVRILANGSYANSRPCPECQALMEYVGIKKAFYSTYEGFERL